MLATLLAILLMLVLFIMSTLGCVLLVGFFLSKLSRGIRILLATLSGPGVIILPIMLLALSDGGGDGFAASLGFSVLGAIVCAFIAWPVAHLATRRLDRMTQFDVGTFE